MKMTISKMNYIPQSDEEWMIPKEALLANAILNAFDENKRLAIEIGVLHGAWSLNVLRNVKSSSVLSIDPYPNLPNLKEKMLDRLKPYNFILFAEHNDLITDEKAALIHIDGLHTEAAVFKDCKWAADNLAEDGVLIVDDYMQPIFPGVAAGWLKFVFDSAFVPFLCTGSKAYLTHKDNYEFWHSAMTNALSNQKTISWCNYLGEGDTVPYISYPTIYGYKVILSYERVDAKENDRILDRWRDQPIVDLVQLID